MAVLRVDHGEDGTTSIAHAAPTEAWRPPGLTVHFDGHRACKHHAETNAASPRGENQKALEGGLDNHNRERSD